MRWSAMHRGAKRRSRNPQLPRLFHFSGAKLVLFTKYMPRSTTGDCAQTRSRQLPDREKKLRRDSKTCSIAETLRRSMSRKPMEPPSIRATAEHGDFFAKIYDASASPPGARTRSEEQSTERTNFKKHLRVVVMTIHPPRAAGQEPQTTLCARCQLRSKS
jgi:hypothetical protein